MAVNRSPSNHWRTFRRAAWLGWQMDSNWTEPWIFALYVIVRPVSQMLILVVMYYVVTRGTAQEELFAGLFVGNAFFTYVGQLTFGMSWVIMEDREFFQTLRQIYLATPNIYSYLSGRALGKFAVTTISVIVILVFGRFILDLPVHLATVRWGLLAAVFPLGIVAAAALGLFMAGVMLITARHGQGYAEALAGALYLVCGVVFPIDVLPSALQAVGRVLPFTYWIEGIRRALLGEGISAALAGVSDGHVVQILLLSSFGLLAASMLFYTWMDRLARQRGLMDQVTEH